MCMRAICSGCLPDGCHSCGGGGGAGGNCHSMLISADSDTVFKLYKNCLTQATRQTAPTEEEMSAAQAELSLHTCSS